MSSKNQRNARRRLEIRRAERRSGNRPPRHKGTTRTRPFVRDDESAVQPFARDGVHAALTIASAREKLRSNLTTTLGGLNWKGVLAVAKEYNVPNRSKWTSADRLLAECAILDAAEQRAFGDE